MDDRLAHWQRRHGIRDEAYRDLLYLLTEPLQQDNYLEFLPQSFTNTNDTSGWIPTYASISNISAFPPQAAPPADLGSFSNVNSLVTQDFEFINMNSPVNHSNPSVQYTPATLSSSASAHVTRPEPKSRKRKHPGTKSTTPCIRCWRSKQKCEAGDNHLCILCSRATPTIPAHVCVRVRFADEAVFHKWHEGAYAQKLAWDGLQLKSSTLVSLCHHQDGPRLPVMCAEFEAVSKDQTTLWYKTEQGWEQLQSSPFALESHGDMDVYIWRSTQYHLARIRKNGSLIDQIFEKAVPNLEDSLLWPSLKLWTANRLLMTGWGLGEDRTLGMSKITDESSSLFGTVPAPRVLQNQLDRRLEDYIAQLEVKCLKMLQDAMRKNTRKSWEVIFLVVVIILHVRERDIWRLLNWTQRASETYKWRHPLMAVTLIQKSVYASNILLAHLHISGETPRDVYNIEESLRLRELQPAISRYNWKDEESVDFSLCSLAFDPYNRGLERVAATKDFGC